MLLVLLTVSCVFCGLGVGGDPTTRTECFGGRFKLPESWTPEWYQGPLSFTPSKGGPSRLLMNDGKAIERRLGVTYTSVVLYDLTDEDDGDFYITNEWGPPVKIATLKILSCAEVSTWRYGDTYSDYIPNFSDFLEFTPAHGPNQLKILWNYTNPGVDPGGRVTVKRDVFTIPDLTQKDNGFYNFRGINNRLIYRLQLVVEEIKRSILCKKEENLLVKYPFPSQTWDATFTHEGKSRNATIMQGGQIVEDHWFDGRVSVKTEGIEIYPVESEDSGTFYFWDPEGNLVMRVNVEVEQDFELAYIAIAGLIVLVVILCCCCCCCKRKKSASPSVVFLQQTPLEDTRYSAAPASPATVNVPQKTTARSLYPQVAPPGARQSALLSSDTFFSGGEPTFELKGVTELPLSSGSTVCDVYTSDKLNVL